MTGDKIHGLPASVRIDDGAITVAADGKATVYLTTPDLESPRRDTVFTLRIVADEFGISVRFDDTDAWKLDRALDEPGGDQ